MLTNNIYGIATLTNNIYGIDNIMHPFFLVYLDDLFLFGDFYRGYMEDGRIFCGMVDCTAATGEWTGTQGTIGRSWTEGDAGEDICEKKKKNSDSDTRTWQ